MRAFFAAISDTGVVVRRRRRLPQRQRRVQGRMSMPVLSRGGSHCCPLVVHRRVLSLLPHFLLEIIATVFCLAVAGSPSQVHSVVVVFVRCCRRRCCLSSCPLPSVALPPRDHRHSFLLGGGRIVRLPFTFSLPWLVVALHLVAPHLPPPLVLMTRRLLVLSSFCSATSAFPCLEAPVDKSRYGSPCCQ